MPMRFCFTLAWLGQLVAQSNVSQNQSSSNAPASILDSVMQDSQWMSTQVTQSSQQFIKFGTALTLDYSTKWGTMGRVQYQAYKLYFDWLNRVHGGIRLHGSIYPVQLILVDDESNPDKVEAITRWLATEQNVSHFLAPFGSTLSARASQVVDEYGGVMVAPTSAAKKVFYNRSRIFGTNAKASVFMQPVIESISDQSVYRSIMYIQEDLSFTKGVCGSLSSLADEYDMRLVKGITVPDDADEEAVKQAVAELQATGGQPDVLVGCVYNNVCHRILRAAKDLGFNPSAIVLTVCVTSQGFLDTAGDLGAFVMGVAPWVRVSSFQSALTNLAVPDFVKEFENEYPGSYVPYQATSTFASAAALVWAIETADSLDPGDVADVLRGMDEMSVFGRISFDENGQNSMSPKMVQTQLHLASLSKLAVVAPHSAADQPMKYPKPTWDSMLCLNRDTFQVGMYGEADNGSCVRCGENQIAPFNFSLGVRVCKEMDCPEGKYSVIFHDQGDSQGGAYCANCYRGYYSESRGASRCRSCALGTYQDNEGQTACLPCVPGKYADKEGSTECLKCGKLESEYATDYNNSFCTPCPQGAVCLPDSNGLFTNFTNADGYYNLIPAGGSSVDGTLYKCVHGEGNFNCRAGGECNREQGTGELVAEGPFCGICRPGFGRADYFAECTRCPSGVSMWFYSFINVLLLFAIANLIWLLVIYTDFTKPKNLHAIIVKQVLNYMGMSQVVFSVVKIHMPFNIDGLPEALSLITGTASPGFGVQAAHCLAGNMSDSNRRYEVFVVLSLIWVPAWILMLTLMFFICWLVSVAQKRPIHSSRLLTLVIVNLFVIHTRSTSLALQILRCHRFDEPRLVLHPSLECSAGEARLWQVLGVTSFFLFSLGIPFFTYMLLRHYKRRDQLNERKSINTVGFLYSGFEPPHYYFEVVFMIRKVLYQVIVLVPGLTGAEDETAERTISCMSMLVLAVVFLAIHMSCEPYDNRGYFTLDRIEAASLWAILVTLLLETWRLVSDKAHAFTDGESLRDIRDTICTVIIAFVHVRFFVITFGLAFRQTLHRMLYCRNHGHHNIVIATWDGVKIVNATDRGRELFAVMFGELADLLIDSSGRVNYQDFTESVQYMCVDCRYHRYRDKLDGGIASTADEDEALAKAVNKIVSRQYLKYVLDNFIIDPMTRMFKIARKSVQQQSQDMMSYMNMPVMWGGTKAAKEEYTERGLVVLHELDNLRKFTRENISSCVGQTFNIDELHMSMVRLQRELRSQVASINHTHAAEKDNEEDADHFGKVGRFFLHRVNSGTSLAGKLGHMIQLPGQRRPSNTPTPKGDNNAAPSPLSPQSSSGRVSIEGSPLSPSSSAHGATIIGQVEGGTRLSGATADGETRNSSRSNQRPSALSADSDTRMSPSNRNSATIADGETGTPIRRSVKGPTTGKHARFDMTKDTRTRPPGVKVESAISPHAFFHRDDLTAGTPTSENNNPARDSSDATIRTNETKPEESPTFAQKLTIAMHKAENVKLGAAGSRADGPDLGAVVKELRVVRQQIDQMCKEHEAEMEQKKTKLVEIQAHKYGLAAELKSARSSAMLSVLKNLPVDSSSEEEENSEEVQLQHRECEVCHKLTGPDHKFCIFCGASRISGTPREDGREDTDEPKPNDPGGLLEKDIKQAELRQEELQEAAYRIKLQIDTASAVEEHQFSLLDGADAELQAARDALSNQAISVKAAEQALSALRDDMLQKVEKVEKTEERIKKLKAEIQQLTARSSTVGVSRNAETSQVDVVVI